MTTAYRPPFSVTAEVVRLVGEICESLGRLVASPAAERTPLLNRENRIRTHVRFTGLKDCASSILPYSLQSPRAIPMHPP